MNNKTYNIIELHKRDGSFCVVLTLLFMLLTSASAWADTGNEADGVDYIDANGVLKNTATDGIDGNDSPTVLTDSDFPTTLNDGWYVVTGSNVDYEGITINGDVHLILADGASMNISSTNHGISVDGSDTSLTIYGQAQGTGFLMAKSEVDNYNYGIFVEGGSVTVNGGNVTAEAPETGIYVNDGVFTVNGGNVTAKGSDGICYDCGAIALNGGNVTVTNNILFYGGTITLAGGTITAGYYSVPEGTITIADGWTYTDGTSAILTGSIGNPTNGTTYQPAWKGGGESSSDPYVIKTTAGLDLLAKRVNSGADSYSGKYFQLDADITYTGTNNYTAIGSQNKPFCGHFDGNNKTISGIRIHKDDSFQGLFGCINSNGDDKAEVKNVILDNATINASGGCGGIVGFNKGGIIENCHVLSNVTIQTNLGNNYDLGGIAGCNASGYTINGCTSSAKLLRSGDNGVEYGGIAGNNQGTVSNCLYLGTTIQGTGSTGAIVGYNNGGSVSNCYFTDSDLNKNAIGAGVAGTNCGLAYILSLGEGITLDATATAYGPLTAYGDFALSYNDGYKTILYSTKGNQVALSYTGTVPDGYVFGGITATAGTLSGNDTDGYTLTMPHFNVTVSAEIYKTDYVTHWQAGPDHDGSSAAKAYIITTTTGLDLLATEVNSGADSYSGKYFQLDADIAYDANTQNNFTPIGTSDNPFKGTFLGNGHKITGINIKNTDLDNAGLFGVVEDATLSGVMVEKASITAASNCGILVGYVKSGTTNTTIERCMTMGSVSGSHDVGGFIGILASDNIIIRECFALGDATGRNSSNTQVGGFVGTIAKSATISDCYSLVTAKGAQRVGGFAGFLNNEYITITRCYAAGVVDGSGSYVGAFVGRPRIFLSITDCAALCNGMKAAGTSEQNADIAELDAADMKNTAKFANWLALNPAIWTQTDGVTQPLLAWSVTNGLKVYTSTGGTGNGSVEVTADSYAPGSIVTINAAADNNSFLVGWTGSTAYADPTNATTTIVLDNHRAVVAEFGKLISIPAELQAVNDDLSGIYGLAKDIDLDGIDWTPIGNAKTRFTGKFYGRGHKILNMSCTKEPEVDGHGLFGGTRGATLDGITVSGTVSANSYFAGGLVGAADGTIITNCHANCDIYNASFHTGGLVGAIGEGTVVTGCSAEGIVSTGYCNAGGLVGTCGSGTVTIRDCVSSAEVIAKDKYIENGAVHGQYIGGFIGIISSERADISDCRADGYVDGYGNTGGFVGCINGNGTVTVTNCVARVDVRSSNNNYGGFIGQADGENATIKDCWCSGAVWGTSGNIGAFVGNSADDNNKPKSTFTNCSVYPYGPGPRYFSGSNMYMTGGVITANDYATMTNGWPAVKKHTHGLIPIATADDLRAVNNNLDGCYVLVDDIDFHGQTIEPIGQTIVTINDGKTTLTDTPFTGEFYGQGHKISRYTVNTTNAYAGLFGNIAGGRVSGVLAEEGIVSRTGDVDATVGVGGFAGTIQSKSMVDDCSFIGKVSNDAAGKNGGFGGFVGRTDELPVILRCFADVEEVDNGSSQPNTGGFVGDHGHGYIVDAYAIGPVTGYANCVGGFAGYVGSAARINNAWCSGMDESQGAYRGAFVGQAHVDCIITNSYYDNKPNGNMKAAGNEYAGGSIPHTGITGLDDMSVQSNFQGFDFNVIWMMDGHYPVFRRGLQHVTFDPAGGTCAIESHDYAIGYDYDSNNNANNGLPEPVRPGYTFAGWFDDNGIKVTNESTVTFDTNRTLHAQWMENVLVLSDAADNTTAIADAATTSKTYNVTLTGRVLWKDGDWNTLCLPFNATLTDDLAGATLMELDTEGTYDNGKKTGLDGTTLNLYFKTAESIEAGKPYIIKWTSGNNIKNPVFRGVTIDNVEPEPVSFTGGKFKGTYDPIVWSEENKSILLLGTNNTLFWPQPEGENMPHLNAFRAYFELNDGASVREFKLNFDGENEVNEVNEVIASLEVNDDSWYTLDGRKLAGKPMKKGMYIHNGNKVVVK